MPIPFWFQHFEITVMSCKVDCELKNLLANSTRTTYYCFFQSLVYTRELGSPIQFTHCQQIVGTQIGMQSSMTSSIKVTRYSLLINVHEKILPSFSSCRIQACMRLTLPLKKGALAYNSCTGWVGGAGNLIPLPAVNSPRMKYRLWRQLFPDGRTSLHCI